MSVLHLASSTNNNGYFTALHRSWARSGLKLTNTPTKSSLSEYRERVSSQFFKDIYEQDLLRFNPVRETFRGHFVYAIDGDLLDLPASESVLAKGYRGAPFKGLAETHYPKMCAVHAVDVVNGVVARFSCSIQNTEINQARAMIEGLEKNSISIYDRLHQTYNTAWAHERAGNYYFIRVKTKDTTSSPPITAFCRSKRRSAWVDLAPPVRNQGRTPTLRVRLIRVKNKKTKQDMVFMTNCPEGLIRNKEACALYLRRWGVESSFKDLTDTLKMCQWHTFKFDGILQEIYALLWLTNNVRRLTSRVTKRARDWLQPDYRKANFKLLVAILMDHLDLLIRGRHRKLRQILSYWINRSVERRKHLSRSYPRQVKRFGKHYKNASRIGRRPAA